MKTRIVIAVALLLGMHAITSWVYAQYGNVTVSAPTLLVTDLPMALGSWEGTESSANSEVFEYFDADSYANRVYRNHRGEFVSLHIALFTGDGNFLPHTPQLCYTRSGWEIEGNDKDISINSTDSTKARMMLCSRQGDRVATLYWYQMGDLIYFDSVSARNARRQLVGQRIRPPVVKVLLQTQLDNSKLAEERLSEIASHVRDWTAMLKPASVDGSQSLAGEFTTASISGEVTFDSVNASAPIHVIVS